jgi:hypothetical protein
MKLIAVYLSLTLTSCATILDSGPQQILVESSPQGADIYVGQYDQYAGQTPLQISLHRQGDTVSVRAVFGEQASLHEIKASMNPLVVGNILFGGIIGIFVDIATGAAMRYPTKPIMFKFNEKHDA